MRTSASTSTSTTTRTSTSTISSTSASTTTPCTCNQGWDAFGDHCYFYGTDMKSWFKAEEYCKEEGGHLASVNTNAIENYVLDGLKNRGLNKAWFGGNDIEDEGIWKWTDHTSWEFTNWGPQEPNNLNGNEDCLEHFTSLQFNFNLWKD